MHTYKFEESFEDCTDFSWKILSWQILLTQWEVVWRTLFLLFLIFCVFGDVTVYMRRSKNNLPELVLSPPCGSGEFNSGLAGLGGKHLFRYAILLSPKSHFLNCLKSKGFKADRFSCTKFHRIFCGEAGAWLSTRAEMWKNKEAVSIWEGDTRAGKRPAFHIPSLPHTACCSDCN